MFLENNEEFEIIFQKYFDLVLKANNTFGISNHKSGENVRKMGLG